MAKNVRIYTVFLTSGWGWGGSKPPRFLLTNEALLYKLENECKDVEFIARDISKKEITFEDALYRKLSVEGKTEACIKEIKRLKENKEIDGVLCFSDLQNDRRLVLNGLPTIVVYNLFEFDVIPYELYLKEEKVITAQVCRLNVVSPSVSNTMFKDLVEKIKLMQVLKKMKESKILMVTDGRLRYFPQTKESLSVKDDKWNQNYIKRLREVFGVKGVIIGTEEVGKEIGEIEDREAEKIARVWIDEAKGIGDTDKGEVVKGARMYLALDRLKDKYNATSILTDTSSFLKTTKILACLASTEFAKQGIACTDQQNTGTVIAQMLGFYLADRPSFQGDLILDTYNSTSIIVHCGAPINPHGDDRVPYLLRDYRIGADVLAELPGGEPVTIWRVNIMDKQILVHTGETVSIDSIYGKGINSLHTILCGTKLVAKVEAKKIQEHFHPQKYGVHWAAIYGDYRKRIKDLAKLAGFEIIEVDR